MPEERSACVSARRHVIMNNQQKVNPNYLGKHPKKKKKQMKPMRCPYCGSPVKMVPESEMNFRFHAKGPAKREFFWVCSRYPECDSYIAADNYTKKPIGLMANAELRHMRMMIHYWQVLLVRNRIYTKGTFASMMASQVNERDPRRIHTSDFTRFQAETILNYMKNLYEVNPQIHELVESKPNSMLWKEMHGLNTGKNHNILYDNETYEEIGTSEWNTSEVESERAEMRVHVKENLRKVRLGK